MISFSIVSNLLEFGLCFCFFFFFFSVPEKGQFLQGVLATSLIWHCFLFNCFCAALLGILHYIMISRSDLLWGLHREAAWVRSGSIPCPRPARQQLCGHGAQFPLLQSRARACSNYWLYKLFHPKARKGAFSPFSSLLRKSNVGIYLQPSALHKVKSCCGHGKEPLPMGTLSGSCRQVKTANCN